MKNVIKFNDPNDWESTVLKEVKETYFIPKFINRNNCLDLGVNIGAFSMVNYSRFDRIIGFEASSDLCQSAKKNFEKNNITGVNVLHLAAYSNSNSTVKLRALEKRELGTNIPGSAHSRDSTILDISNNQLDELGFNHGVTEEFEEVNTINFSDTALLFNNERINYIKCDIEGAEYDFFVEADLRTVDFISMELHYTFLGKDKVAKLMKHFDQYFEFYGAYNLNDFLNSWPPPQIVNLINKEIITPKIRLNLMINKILNRLKNII